MNDSDYEVDYSQGNEGYIDNFHYQERRQKDNGADNPHYHWDYVECQHYCIDD